MTKARVCISAFLIFSLLLLLPSASAAELPPSDGIVYDTSASAEVQIKPSGTAVTSIVSGNTYYGISQTEADWNMGDGAVYYSVKEVEHLYADGKYQIIVNSSEETWNAEVSISDHERTNVLPLAVMIAGSILVIICVCRAIPDRIGIVAASTGIVLLALSTVCYAEGWL